MGFVDYILLVLLFVVQPIHGAFSYRQYVSAINKGTQKANVIKLYNQTMAFLWISTFVVLIVWFWLDRSLPSLGFVYTFDDAFWWSLLAVALVCTYLVAAIGQVSKLDEDKKAKQQTALGDLRHFLPQNDSEYKKFVGVSLSAGFCEELIYRGYVFWCLSHFLPLWSTVIFSSVVFALAHSYQGISGVIRVFFVGCAFGGLYAISGSLWLPIIAHALVDVLQGASILQLFKQNKEADGRLV